MLLIGFFYFFLQNHQFIDSHNFLEIMTTRLMQMLGIGAGGHDQP